MLDKLWVRRIIAGDKAAGERFVSENYPRIFRLLRFLTGRVDIAEDLTQQTFVKAWQGIEGFQGAARLATWLQRIAYHEYTHWLRDRRECAPLEAAGQIAAPLTDPDLDVLVLPSALAQLSQDHRETFILYHVQELSIAEVASILDVPTGTVKSRLFFARQRLRELLEPPSTVVPCAAAPAPQIISEIAKEGRPHELSAPQPQR